MCTDAPLRLFFDMPPMTGAGGWVRVFDAANPTTPVDSFDIAAPLTFQTIGGRNYFYKPIARELVASLDISNGICVGSMDYTDPTQQLGPISFSTGRVAWGSQYGTITLAEIPSVVLSEVIRDVDLMGALGQAGT